MGGDSKREAYRKMKYCVDTWFLLELHNKNEKAMRIFRETVEGKNRIVIPTVSILELIRVAIRTGESLTRIDSMLSELKVTQKVQLIVLDEIVAKEAARISVSYNIPTVDSVVAATCKISGSDILLSKDDDLIELSKKKYMKIESW